MDPVSASSVSFADSAALRDLTHKQHIDEQAKLREAGRQFEAVLVRQMLKETMKPVFGGLMQGSGSGQKIYQDMVTESLAEALTQNTGFGFTSALMQQFPAAQPAPDDAQPKR